MRNCILIEKKACTHFGRTWGVGTFRPLQIDFLIRRTTESSPHVFVCGFCSPHGTGCSEDGLTVLCSVHVGSSCVCTKNNHKQTNAMSFCHSLSPFAENPQLRMRFLPRPWRCNNESTSTMCENRWAIITVLMKTMKIHYVLKGLNENPAARMRKKGGVSVSRVDPPHQEYILIRNRDRSRSALIPAFAKNPCCRLLQRILS